jgi:caa(3)-type oxidase subunit IV
MIKASTLVVVWLVLLALTGAAWGLAYVHLGPLLIAVELVLAVAHAVLVLLYFMGLLGGRSSYVLVPVVAVWFVALLVGLTALDVATRKTFPRQPIPERQGDRQ